MEFLDPKVVEYGLVGVALIVIYRVLGILQHVLLSKKGLLSTMPNGTPAMTPLACQVDATHFQRIKDIHDYTEAVQHQIAEGQFACAWQGRDEVRDLLESMRAMTTAMQNLTVAMNGRHR